MTHAEAAAAAMTHAETTAAATAMATGGHRRCR